MELSSRLVMKRLESEVGSRDARLFRMQRSASSSSLPLGAMKAARTLHAESTTKRSKNLSSGSNGSVESTATQRSLNTSTSDAQSPQPAELRTCFTMNDMRLVKSCSNPENAKDVARTPPFFSGKLE